MPEKALLVETLSQILGATERILKRFKPIQTSDDFLKDEAGLEKLDAICMQLITILTLMQKRYSMYVRMMFLR